MPTYDIIVVNTDPSCNNSITQQITVTGSPQDFLVQIESNSTAQGPFDVYTGNTGTTAVYTAQTRADMVAGQIISF